MIDEFKVLIVEDEILAARSLKIDLEELGIEVLKPIAKGEDAVNVAFQENPSLILMNIRLAGRLDGIEASERIIFEKDIPIVFITGYTIEEINERTLKVDPIDYLEKPVDINKIKKIIDMIKNE